MQRYRQCYGKSGKKALRTPLLRNSASASSALRSKSPLPQGTKFDLSNKRELMNCIAFGPGNQRDTRWMETWNDDSFSSDSSSDITDVSPASSLSDFGESAIVLEELPISCAGENSLESQKELSETSQITHLSDKPKSQETESLLLSSKNDKVKKMIPVKKIIRSPAVGKHIQDSSSTLVSKNTLTNNVTQENHGSVGKVENEKKELVSTSEQAEGGDLQLLVDALGELEGGGQHMSMRLSGKRLNLSFTPEKARQIARENANLLGRLQRARNRGTQIKSPPGPTEASAAINRRKKQRQIQHENMILLRKITTARATMSIQPRQGSQGSSNRPRSATMNYAFQ